MPEPSSRPWLPPTIPAPFYSGRRSWLCALAALCVCWHPLLAWPADGEAEDHAVHSVRVDKQLELDAVLEAVLERHPRAGVMDALASRAAAESRYSDAWFPDGASLIGYHMSDRNFDDIGAQESQVAMSLPLWHFGEKRAQADYGDSLSAESASARREWRWLASGSLRQSLWGLEAARRQWQLATEQEERLAGVLEQVRIQAAAGALARADELAALQEYGAWQSETLDREAAYQDAVRSYRALSGLEVMPAGLLETLSPGQEIDLEHPALARARDQVAHAEAGVELAVQKTGARPSLELFWRDNRADRELDPVNSLGIGLTVPLGRSPRGGAEIAGAEQTLAEARAHLAETQRELDLQLHEARHMLHTTGEQLAIADAMLSAGRERNQMDKTEFELGEISMSEWLRRLSAFRAIEQRHELLQIQRGAAIAAYNQAIGDTL